MNKLALAFIFTVLGLAPAAHCTPSLGMRVLYSSDGVYFVMGKNGSLNIGSAKDKKFLRSINIPDGFVLGIYPGGKKIAMTEFTKGRLLSVSMKGELLDTTDTAGQVLGISATFKHLLTYVYRPNASVYTISSFSKGRIKPEYVFKDDNAKAFDRADFSCNDKYFAYSYNNLNAQGRVSGCFANVINLATGKSAGMLPFPPGDNDCALRFSTDGKLLAFGSSKVRVVSVPGWKLLKTVSSGEGHLVSTIHFSPSGAHMAVLYSNGDIRVYSLPGCAEVYKKYYNQIALDIAFSPDGGTLAVVFADGRVNFMDISKI